MPDAAQRAAGEAAAELRRAVAKFGPMASPHEGWAVLQEEVEELWACVKANDGRAAGARAEAIQVAAMALRYIIDLCDERQAATPQPADSGVERPGGLSQPGDALVGESVPNLSIEPIIQEAIMSKVVHHGEYVQSEDGGYRIGVGERSGVPVIWRMTPEERAEWEAENGIDSDGFTRPTYERVPGENMEAGVPWEIVRQTNRRKPLGVGTPEPLYLRDTRTGVVYEGGWFATPGEARCWVNGWLVAKNWPYVGGEQKEPQPAVELPDPSPGLGRPHESLRQKLGLPKHRICGITCECGPNREPLGCGYAVGHEGAHSWATLPTFPLHPDTVVNELWRVSMQHYGGADRVPAAARDALAFCIETFKSDPNARSV